MQMRSYVRFIAIILVIVIFGSMTAGFATVSYGATIENINVSVVDYNIVSNELKIGWNDSLLNSKTKSVRLSYHKPGTDELAPYVTQKTVSKEALLTTCLIAETFEDNIMYDIHLEMLDINDNAIGYGFLYFTPRISFYARNLNQEKQMLSGGGYEIGVSPQMNLEWTMPKVWANESAGFVYVNTAEALAQIKDEMALINKQADIASVNFNINISTNKGNLNAGSSQASINVKQGMSEYTASVSGFPTSVGVEGIASNGRLNFNILGRATKDTQLPEAAANTLPYGDLLPGTVYYMNIKPVFLDSSNKNINVVSVGKPEQQNGSYLTGTTEYAYTPIRFQLTKDDADNIYVKIFKINQGSLDLPRLYYEVQVSDDSSAPGEWPVKKSMDDTYFVNDYAINVLTGINPSNLLYYKIIVKSDNIVNRLESLPLGYQSGVDTGRSPVPVGLKVNNILPSTRDVIVPSYPEPVSVSSSDVTISWKKPQNWDSIKNDLYFHFLLSTAQTPIDNDSELILTEAGAEDIYLGNYNTKYRLVKYVNALSYNILEAGDYLYYTLDAFDLFKVDKIDNDGISDVTLPNSENYPDFLLPNKIYYLQMYTSKAEDIGSADDGIESSSRSETSVIISFTTLAAKNSQVPLPKNLRLSLNESYSDDTGKIYSKIEVQFDKANISWADYLIDLSVNKAVYYDLYMGTSMNLDTFKLIGTTFGPAGDVKFTGASDSASTSVKAEISIFNTLNTRAAFGDCLRPNSIYYFAVRTRLSVENMQSSPTSVLAVTTKSIHVNPPDPDEVVPFAPRGFDVAEDIDGQPVLTGSEVTFEWTDIQNSVTYEIIVTSTRLEPDASVDEYENDYIYRSFKENLGIISLDINLEDVTENFHYDIEDDKCYFTIDRWLFPNRLYYFSIRAVNKGDNRKKSAWVSIPVTTQITDAPSALDAVVDYQLGFYWTDNSPGMRAEDYYIYAKGPKDSDYKLLDSFKASVVQDGDTFYARLYELDANSNYAVKVLKGPNKSIVVYASNALSTRDGYHNLEVKWKGETSYKYELVIKGENDKDYTVLREENFEAYYDRTGKRNAYYLEETNTTTNSAASYFYAKIKTIPVKSADGSIRNMALNSNTKYSVKVRAVKVDLLGIEQPAYSKYVGPVDVRTDFSQQDYDDTEQTEQEKGLFLDKIKDLERKLFWQLDMQNSFSHSYLLKGDRVSNLLLNNSEDTLVFDFSVYNTNGYTDTVYIPIRVVQAINESSKTIKIKSTGFEYILRPGMFDTVYNEALKRVHDNTGVRDTYIEITVVSMDYSTQQNIPEGTAVSKLVRLNVRAVGTNFTDVELTKEVESRLYGAENGIVKNKIDLLPLLHGYDDISLDYYFKTLVAQIESGLSFVLYNKIYYSTVATAYIYDFSKPLAVKMKYNDNSSVISPYAQYAGSTAWTKLPGSFESSTMSFNALKSGSYVILASSIPTKDVPDSVWKDKLPELYSLYDFAAIFGSSRYLRPGNNVTVEEAVLVFETISGSAITQGINDIKLKAGELGIGDIVDTRNLSRGVTKQEMASLAIKLYCDKTGSYLTYLKPKSIININDNNQIARTHYKAVEMALDFKLMSLNDEGMFFPDEIVNRGELIGIIIAILTLTGDI